MKNHSKLIDLSLIVSFAAMAIVAGLIEIPWFVIPPFPLPFLSLDFSDVVILISMATVGFGKTSAVVFLRTIVRRLVLGIGPIDWIGEISAVSASFLIMFSFMMIGALLKTNKKSTDFSENGKKYNLKEYFITILFVVLLQTLVMPLIAFFLTTPMFSALFGIGEFHFSVIGWFPTQNMFASWNDYINFCLIAFVPFNITKSFLIANIFYFIKPMILAITRPTVDQALDE